MKKLLFIVLLIVGCEDDDNLSSQSSEIEVDWVLVKVDSFRKDFNIAGEDGIYGVGYRLFFTNSSGINIEEDILENNTGMLSFTYNEELYTYDLSDSFNQEYSIYFFEIFASHSCQVLWCQKLERYLDFCRGYKPLGFLAPEFVNNVHFSKFFEILQLNLSCKLERLFLVKQSYWSDCCH